MASKLTSREADYSKWYNELVVQADLAQHSDVKGCMVIKPYGLFQPLPHPPFQA